VIPNAVPRVAAPLVLAAAILVSFRAEPPAPPVELKAGQPPTPSAAETREAFARALEPGAPGYDRGVTRAPVTVLEFSDFGCPYCERFATGTYPQLADEFVKTGIVRWRYVPFVLGIFTHGDDAARAAVCAGAQGNAAFSALHDQLYEHQDEWKRAADPAGEFRVLARAARLDVARFASCYASAEADTVIRDAGALADQLGVRATPTFFVNGRRVEGALPADQFRAVLMDALRRSQAH
jgi:protein-disulfide isomerase